jgi:hypothetical protein
MRPLHVLVEDPPGHLDQAGMRVGLFDWELAGEDHRDRLERLFGANLQGYGCAGLGAVAYADGEEARDGGGGVGRA